MKKSIAKRKKVVYKRFRKADLAQLVEQLICNHQVVCSSQTIGTIKKTTFEVVFLMVIEWLT